MNHIYRVVWNRKKAIFEAVSEFAKGQTKNSQTRESKREGSKVGSVAKSVLALAATSVLVGQAFADDRNLADNEVFSMPSNEDILSGQTWTLNENSQAIVGDGKKLTIYYGGEIHFAKDNGVVTIFDTPTVGELTNHGTISAHLISNGITINNRGKFLNTGIVGDTWTVSTITNASGASIENRLEAQSGNKGEIWISDIKNAGNIDNKTDALIVVSNSFENSGTVVNEGNINFKHATELDNSNVLTNLASGKIGMDGTVTINNGAGAVISNAGEIGLSQSETSIINKLIDNHGTIINESGGVIVSAIQSDAVGTLSTHGVMNSLGATINGDVFLSGAGTLSNVGEISNMGSKGIILSDSSVLENTGTIEIKNVQINLPSVYYNKSITLNNSATLNNNAAGTIVLNGGTGANEKGHQFVVASKTAVVNNFGSIEIKDTTKESSLKTNGTFNNNVNATLKLGVNVWAYIGYGAADDASGAVLNNHGSIVGAADPSKPNYMFMSGDSTLVMHAGSSLTGVILDAAYWYNQYSAQNSFKANATIVFDGGASNFNPEKILFGYANEDDFYGSNQDGIWNFDVKAGVHQKIASDILTYQASGSSTVWDGSVNKKGAGTLVLDGQSNYSKGTNVQEGGLYIGSASGNGAKIDGPVSVANGAILGGHGVINGNVNVASGAGLSAGAGSNNAGTLTINGDLILNSNSYINYDLSDAAADSFIVNGHLATNGAKLNVNAIGDITTGLMREVFQYTTASNTDLIIGTTPQGTNASQFSITNNGNKIYINAHTTVVGNTVLKFWNPDAAAQAMGSGGNGIWSASSTTWTNSLGTLTPNVLDSTADYAVFAGSSGTVTVSGTVNAKGLQFLSDYTLTGGTVALDSGTAGQTYISTGGNASSGNTVTINSVIDGANGINKLDAGKLILTGANTYTGGTTVSGGTLQGNATSIQGNVAVLQNAIIAFDINAGAEAFANIISGAGSVVKTGVDELTLAGANTYTGGTDIQQGTLTGSSVSVQGNVVIASGANLKLAQTSNGTLSGQISGAGRLVKEGSGTVELTGSNSYSGDTQVNAGTLSGNSASLQGTVNVSVGAEVTFNQTAEGIFAGNITGAGTTNKTGSGSLTVNGGIATALTNVQQGHLHVGDSSNPAAYISGNVNVVAGASMGGNGTVNGLVNVQTGGNMILNADQKLSVNDLTLNGNNALEIQGITSIDAVQTTKTVIESNNTISGDFTSTHIAGVANSVDYMTAAVAKDATGTKYELQYGLSWFHNDPGVVSGNFTLADPAETFEVNVALTDNSSTVPTANAAGWDGNTLNKHGAGTLILNDVNTYTGLTDIHAGKVVVGATSTHTTAQIAGDVDVHSGAALGGHGQVLGDVTMRSGASLAPGNSIGTITVNNITFAAGSVLEFDVEPNGASDLVDVTGTATINGGTVSVIAGSAGTWADNTTYTVLAAANPIAGTGQFDNVNSNLAFLTPSLSYDANNVYLTMTRNQTAFMNVGITNNQRQTGFGIATLPNYSPVAAAIVEMSADQARYAYDNLSGEIYASANSALLHNSRYARTATLNHLDKPKSNLDANKALWVDVWGSRAPIKGKDGNSVKLSNKDFGFIVGYDAYSNGDTILGVAAGYENMKLKVDSNRSSSIDVDAFNLMAYGRTKAGFVDIKGGIGYSALSMDSTRHITVSGLQSKNEAKFKGNMIQAYIEGSHTVEVTPSVDVTPYANLSYIHLKTNGFTEKGGTSILHKNSRNDDTTLFTLGAKANWKLDDQGSAVYVNIGWQNQLGGTQSKAKLNFFGGQSYDVKGVKADSNGAVLGLGINYQVTPNLRLGAGYEGFYGSKTRDHGLKAQVEFKF